MARYRFTAHFILTVVVSSVLITEGYTILHYESLGIPHFTPYSLGEFAIGLGIFSILVILFQCYCYCLVGIEQKLPGLYFCHVFVYLLVLLQIVLGVASLVMLKNDKGQLDNRVLKVVTQAFDEYVHAPNNLKIIDEIQQNFTCCGIKGPKYWISGPPKSCYPFFNKDNEIYPDGCANKYKETIAPKIKTVGDVALIFVFAKMGIEFFAYVTGERIRETYLNLVARGGSHNSESIVTYRPSRH